MQQNERRWETAKRNNSQKKHRSWIWERNNTNTVWLAGWMAGWSRGLAGRVSTWLAVCHPRWLAGREIGAKNWIRKLDVPISELTFRNGVSNFRSNFPFQFFSAFHCRGALGKIGSRNWIGNWKRHFGRLIQKLERPIRRSNFAIQFYDPIFRSRPAGGLAWSTAHGFRPPCDSRPQLAVQKAAVGIGRPPDPMYPIFFGDFFR